MVTKTLSFLAGVLVAFVSLRNAPPLSQPSRLLLALVLAGLLWLAYRAGRDRGATAVAVASASADAVAVAGGGAATSMVTVVVVPAGADPAVVAEQLGTVAYTVEAPAAVALDAGHDAVESLGLPGAAERVTA
ncbi:MAG: hypothetical protein JWM84_3148 [Nocardioides sp.]|nr:hypothetical protein [Nocardioides sp.]